MAQTYSPEAAPRVTSQAGTASYGRGLAAALFVAAISLAAIYQQWPPRVVEASAPPDFFSAARALEQLKKISQAPHPIGSAEHALVRERILQELNAQGLQPEVQTATVVSARRGNALRAATVNNVVARLKGNGGGKAVLVASHYDSVTNSPGAADDGSAVAVMLETLRALKAGPALKNDVIFLFTDGEETGLLGARAFAEQNQAAKDVGVALNFEARGSGGPVVMFETSGGNAWLIDALADAASHPRASSLAYEVYKLLPNDTDLTVFKEAGMPGMNFAFIEGAPRYHTHADDLENIDARSVQHQGSYALPLVRHFGNLEMPAASGGDAVYTDVLGLAILHYPASWVLPLTLLVALLFAAATMVGLKRRRLTLGGMARGVAVFALGVVCSAAVAWLTWWLMSFAQLRMGRELADDFYQGRFYLAAFAALSVAVVCALYLLLGRRAGGEDLAWGAEFCCLLALVAASVMLPGGSYLFAWPLMFCVLALLFAVALRGVREGGAALTLVVGVCLCPAVVLLVPMVYQTFDAVGLGLAWAVAALAGLLLGLLVSHFAMLGVRGHKSFPVAAGVAGVALLALAALAFSFDRRHPKSDNVFYMMNADTGRAVWASADAAPDEWTAQFLTQSPERGSITEYTPLYSGSFMKKQAEPAALGAPTAELLEGGGPGGARTLRLRIVPARPGASVSALVEGTAGVTAAEVNGKRVANTVTGAPGGSAPPWSIQYWAAPAEGFELKLEVKTAGPVKLALVERTDGLPQLQGAPARPRPEYLMPSPTQASDASFIGKTFSF